jgi:hypothetical protein
MIMLTGNGKTKTLLNPKPKPKVYNAFAILSQSNTPTHYNALCPTQQIDDNKTIIPPGPQEHRRQQKITPKDKICSLPTASPKPRMNAQPLPRTTPTIQSTRKLIPPMHNASNQLSGLPNMDKLWHTTWVPRCQFCQAKQSTPIQCHFNP